jgi:hypothetical protein
MPTDQKDDDAMKLSSLAKGLPAVDLDPARAAHIAQRARVDLGHGPPKRRSIEAILVALLVVTTLVWALYEAYLTLH